MGKNLMEWFYSWPVYANTGKLQWRTETSLKHNLEKILESKPGLSLEETLIIFIQQFRDGSEALAVKYLQAYLCRIAAKQTEKLHKKLKHQSDYKSRYNLPDIYQIGFQIVYEKNNDGVEWVRTIVEKYNGEKTPFKIYAEKKLSSEISSRCFQLVGMNDRQKRAIKHTRYFNLKNPTGKKDSNQTIDDTKVDLEDFSRNANNIKQKLEYFGYIGLELERRFLSWKCFNQIYTPRQKYPKWTEEQLKQMAELYQTLRRRSPKLKDDNLQVDAELIDQWLEDCLRAWYKSIPKPEFSLDVPLTNDDMEGETRGEQITDYHYAWDGNGSRSVKYYHASEVNYYQAMRCHLQKSLAEFCETLNKEEYRLVLLVFSFDWGDVGRNLAPLLKKDQSTINRQYKKIKVNWLKKLAKELGVDEKNYQLSRDGALSSALEDVWQIYAKPSYRSIIYQELQKICSKLDSITADVVKTIESELLQWLEAELEMPLASYKLLNNKISDLVDEFLIDIYQESIH